VFFLAVPAKLDVTVGSWCSSGLLFCGHVSTGKCAEEVGTVVEIDFPVLLDFLCVVYVYRKTHYKRGELKLWG
jgi:hypothetical protein